MSVTLKDNIRCLQSDVGKVQSSYQLHACKVFIMEESKRERHLRNRLVSEHQNNQTLAKSRERKNQAMGHSRTQ